MGMRTVTRWKPAALGVTALLALAMLSGCVPAATHTSTPTPEATPLFATDDEALAAATKAYAAYLKMSDTILSDGGAHPERLNNVATGDALVQLKKDLAPFVNQKLHTTGRTTFDSMKLQSRSDDSIAAYVCEDVTDIDVLDASGKSLVKDTRDPRTSFEVVMVRVDGRLLLGSRTWWTAGDICGR